MIELYIVAIDYDGCCDHDGMTEQVEIFLNKILHEANTHVQLMVGSVRQNLAVNRLPKIKNNSDCSQRLHNLHEKFVHKYPEFKSRLLLTPLLAESFHATASIEYNLNIRVNNIHNIKATTGDSSCLLECLDDNKIVLTRAQILQALSNDFFPYDSVHYCLIDSRNDVLEGLSKFYQNNLYALPKVHVQLYRIYNSTNDLGVNSSSLVLHSEFSGLDNRTKPDLLCLYDLYFNVITKEKNLEKQYVLLLGEQNSSTNLLRWFIYLFKKHGWHDAYQFVKSTPIPQDCHSRALTVFVIASMFTGQEVNLQHITKKLIDPLLKIKYQGQELSVFELSVNKNIIDWAQYSVIWLVSTTDNQNFFSDAAERFIRYGYLTLLCTLLDNLSQKFLYQFPMMKWAVKYKQYNILKILIDKYYLPTHDFSESHSEYSIEQALELACMLEDMRGIFLLLPHTESLIFYLSWTLEHKRFKSFEYLCKVYSTLPKSFSVLFRQEIENFFPILHKCAKLKLQNLALLLIDTVFNFSPGVRESFKESFELQSLALDLEPATLRRSRIGIIVSIFQRLLSKTTLMNNLEFFYARIRADIDDPLYADEANTLYCIIKKAEREFVASPDLNVLHLWLINLLKHAMRNFCTPQSTLMNSQMLIRFYLDYQFIMHGYWWSEMRPADNFLLFIREVFNQSGLGMQNEYIKLVAKNCENLHSSMRCVLKWAQEKQPRETNLHIDEAFYRLKILFWRVQPQNHHQACRLIEYWASLSSTLTGVTYNQLFANKSSRTSCLFFYKAQESMIDELKNLVMQPTIIDRLHSLVKI